MGRNFESTIIRRIRHSVSWIERGELCASPVDAGTITLGSVSKLRTRGVGSWAAFLSASGRLIGQGLSGRETVNEMPSKVGGHPRRQQE
jgi:hypothetical protein